MVFMQPSRASAGPPEFLVEVDRSCPTLRAAEIAGHLEIEAQHEVQIVDGVWSVLIKCDGTMVDVTARRPATGASASRLVPSPEAEDPQRERILALATLPLLRLAKAEVAAIEAPALPPEAELTQRTKPKPAPAPEPEPVLVRTDSIEVSAGAAIGGTQAPPWYPRLGFAYSHWFGAHWGLRAGANIGFGQVFTDHGQVSLVDVPLSLAASWRSKAHILGGASGRLQLALAFEAGAQYMRGHSESAGFVGEPLTGPSGGARGSVAYYFGLSPALDLGVALEGGWRGWGIIGRVNGVETTSWLGPWGGASLRLRFGFNRPS
jgi:hypothetical protein